MHLPSGGFITSIIFLIQLVRVGLDHVDEIRENLFFLYRNGFEVFHDGLHERGKKHNLNYHTVEKYIFRHLPLIAELC